VGGHPLRIAGAQQAGEPAHVRRDRKGMPARQRVPQAPLVIVARVAEDFGKLALAIGIAGHDPVDRAG
jgi:hypothetical protein